MYTLCVYHEELMSLDVTPNPNSFSRLLLILLDPKSFQTALDFHHMTSRSRAYHLSLFHCRLIIIILNPNPSPSLSTLSSYNTNIILIISLLTFFNKKMAYMSSVLAFIVNTLNSIINFILFFNSELE